MIISFNPSIFKNPNAEIQVAVAQILVALIKPNIHFIDIKSINEIFYNERIEYIFDSNPIALFHLSLNHRKLLRDFISKIASKPITSLHKAHLRHITIGNDQSKNEIHPNDAYRIITERSKIIVENGINDWKFIKGIVQKYSGAKTDRRSIYKLLDLAIRDENLESDNSGGVGEIVKKTKQWIGGSRYRNIYKYKLMAIFDSDKHSANEFVTTHKNQIKFFKNKSESTEPIQPDDYEYNESTDVIIWHILHKRKIENYIPLNVLFKSIKSITEAQKNNLNSKSNAELDFIEYDYSNIGIGKQEIKEKFPEMFLSGFSYRDLEQRCEHHKYFLPEANELVSEIEKILLKMAKII